MSENKDIQGKSTQVVGLKKSVHKSVLKDGEYHHLKNGTISSFEGDIPFIQNMPSNIECVTLPIGYKYIGSIFIKERDYHVLFLSNPTFNKSEIGFFYGKECKYETKLNQDCLNFNIAYSIKCQYKIKNCQLHLYYQDALNKDRYLNLDDLPYKKQLVNGCYVDTDVFDCEAINVRNDLTHPIVKPKIPIDSGALSTGVYQFAICYSNINGDEQSSYYSVTNPLPIYEDNFTNYKSVEGSQPNKLTNKAIPVEFFNLDTRYEYINLAVIKTVQGTPTYELVAILPISTKDYLYTGREVTKLLSIDRLLGLSPDYFNSKTITSANNYLIRANLSTRDEANYQPFANLIELEWAVVRKKADNFESSYKNPINSVEYKGYQRGEVYPFGIRLLLSNGQKTSVFHIPGRKAKSSDLIKYTIDNIPSGESCNFYELLQNEDCSNQRLKELYHWQVYDTATILEEKELKALKMNALLAVGAGSQFSPKLITLEYRGNKTSKNPIVFVGKGITFDTGGHSLKNPTSMLGMKFDMSGAATVLGILKFAAQLNLPINLVGVIPTAENTPGPTAYRPDDIITTMAGITVEVLNTDAEGRLILCDALKYCERYRPQCVIDIATLTGACIVALGSHHSGLFSSNQELANKLLAAGQASCDKCWQLPITDEYHQQLESSCADIANVGGSEGGAITAACFLSKFTTAYPWAHLDIAGTASRATGKEKGATGRPIPLLAEFLLTSLKD